MTFGLLLLGFYAVLFLQIILHEFGHMIAGWLSGYQFTSFRVGSLMWVRQGGRCGSGDSPSRERAASAS